MESEASNQINNDYTKWFFYATMCHVCKQFGDGVKLQRCSDCKMIYYCGKEHQRQHWEEHESLCVAIQVVLGDHRMDYRGEATEDWAGKKLTFAQRVSSGLGRHLNASEMDMFLFPKECLFCHERNIKLLKDCQKCAASFCKNHKNHIDHWDICAPLELCLRTNLFFSTGEGYKLSASVLQNNPCTNTVVYNMRDFIKAFVHIQTDSEMVYNIVAANSSEYLTRPLTLFYAVQSLNYILKSAFLIIHVVGANYVEEATLWTWEFFLQLMETVTSVTIVMIGPGLKDKFDPSRTFDDRLLLENKSLFFEYNDVSYENYVRSPSFVKPDLIVGFNLSIQERELESNKEIWAPSIHALAKQNCPFILTFCKLRELVEGMSKMNTILGKELDYFFWGKNPFASCRPHRDHGPEHVFYYNQYMVIYRSLPEVFARN